jgi:hypothetical protein
MLRCNNFRPKATENVIEAIPLWRPLPYVTDKGLRLQGGNGGMGATGARPDFGVMPDRELAILPA